jgi:hypothetical protein
VRKMGVKVAYVKLPPHHVRIVRAQTQGGFNRPRNRPRRGRETFY